MSAKKLKSDALKEELANAESELQSTETQAAELAASGNLDAAGDLAGLNARTQILRGTIQRLSAAIPDTERQEAAQEAERLKLVIERETRAAENAADKIAKAAAEILIPAENCEHPLWSFEFRKRRRHEIGLMAADHADARKHADAARNATSKRRNLLNKR